MKSLEVSGAVRPIYWSLGVKRLRMHGHTKHQIYVVCKINSSNGHLMDLADPGSRAV